MEAVLNAACCFAAPCLVLGLATGQAALAHGDERPRHGGVIQFVRDVSYELADHESGLMLYVADHGNPVPTVGITGTLVLMRGTQRSVVVLQPVGENGMLARGVKPASGYRATAMLKMPAGRELVVVFPAKSD